MKNNLSYLIMLFSIWMIGGCVNTKKERKDIRNYTSVQFESDTLNLGYVKMGEKVSAKFVYTNTGEYPLIIKNVQATCGCTEVRWNKNPLLLQKSDSINIVFTGEDKGYFKKTIFVVCNIWKKVYQLQLKGYVVD